MDQDQETEIEADTVHSAAQEQCTKQSVQIAAQSARFLLNQPKAGLYIAGIASRSTGTAAQDKFYALRLISILRGLLPKAQE